jgi:hypothetical protein
LVILGALVIGFVVLITYHPALEIGFWYDDFNHLEMAGRPSASQFMASIFGDSTQRLFRFYRPIQQIQWRMEYLFLGSNSFCYHVLQNLYHFFNCILLYRVIGRLSRNWRTGFVGVFIYSVLPAYSIAVFWLGVPGPLASMSYLLAIWMWIDYLEKGGYLRWGLTFVSFLISLFSQEIAITLPVTLLLIDRWLVAKPSRWNKWVLRILPFFLFLPIWVLLEWDALRSMFSAESSAANWGSLFSNIVSTLSMLSFPWAIDSPLRYVALAVCLGLFLFALVARKLQWLFLGILGFISVIPAVNSAGISSRNLYLPMMVSAAGTGIIAEGLCQFLEQHFPQFRLTVRAVFALLIVVVVARESMATAEAATNFSGVARRARIQFQPIYRRHTSFDPDTLLYFIEPPFASYNVSGLMFLRYGANVWTRGTDNDKVAELRRHNAAYVFYQDEQNSFREQRVNPTATLSTSPTLPAQFGNSLILEGFEVVDTIAKPNEAIILILYWYTLKEMDRDYTVFAHLLDEQGTLLTSYDGLPRRGASLTSTWRPGSLNVDATILPISSNMPPGQNYQLEIGMYYLPTMERLPVKDASGAAGDKVVFRPFIGLGTNP